MSCCPMTMSNAGRGLSDKISSKISRYGFKFQKLLNAYVHTMQRATSVQVRSLIHKKGWKLFAGCWFHFFTIWNTRFEEEWLS